MSELFNQNDIESLEKMSQVRLRIVDKLSKDKLPDDPNELALLAHVTDIETKAILQKARVKSSDKTAQAMAGIGYSMAELLRRTQNSPTAAQRTEIPTLDKSDIPDDIVPGETSMGHKPIDPDEIPI